MDRDQELHLLALILRGKQRCGSPALGADPLVVSAPFSRLGASGCPAGIMSACYREGWPRRIAGYRARNGAPQLLARPGMNHRGTHKVVHVLPVHRALLQQAIRMAVQAAKSLARLNEGGRGRRQVTALPPGLSRP